MCDVAFLHPLALLIDLVADGPFRPEYVALPSVESPSTQSNLFYWGVNLPWFA